MFLDFWFNYWVPILITISTWFIVCSIIGNFLSILGKFTDKVGYENRCWEEFKLDILFGVAVAVILYCYDQLQIYDGYISVTLWLLVKVIQIFVIAGQSMSLVNRVDLHSHYSPTEYKDLQ